MNNFGISHIRSSGFHTWQFGILPKEIRDFTQIHSGYYPNRVRDFTQVFEKNSEQNQSPTGDTFRNFLTLTYLTYLTLVKKTVPLSKDSQPNRGRCPHPRSPLGREAGGNLPASLPASVGRSSQRQGAFAA
jgi:hypothetical protein